MPEIRIIIRDFADILSVLPQTLAMTIVIFACATILGILIALVIQYKIPFLKQIVIFFNLFLKGTPMVIYIFLIYFIFPDVVGFFTRLFNINFDPQSIPPVVTIVVALTGTLGPFQAEIIRGSFLSIDYGQVEAAHSLGYSFFQTFRWIILPQAVLTALPDLTNSVLVILKALSLAFTISVVDIFAKAQMVAALNFHYLEAFSIVAIIYWGISVLLTKLTGIYEQKMRGRV